MKTIIGHCPQCGAPIYVPSVWHGITAPANEYSCGCFPQPQTITTDFVQMEGTGTSNFEQYTYPYIIDTIVNDGSIEIVYRQDPTFTFTTGFCDAQPDPKIYKIIYSCKKGKWHQSEKIEGNFVPSSGESYEF